MNNDYVVYLLECSDKSYYCGTTNNLTKRLYDHNHTKKGAKYTKSRRPIKLIAKTGNMNKSNALKKEKHVKSLQKNKKLSCFSIILNY